MTKEIGHASFLSRIAINVGAGYVPGINAVIMGAALAAGKLGWEMVGIRDGFDGLLHSDRYPDGGLLTLSPELVENLDPTAAGLLGQASRVDPFHVRQVNEDDMVEEVDMSDDLLKRLRGCISWTTTRRRPMTWSSDSRPSSTRPLAAGARKLPV